MTLLMKLVTITALFVFAGYCYLLYAEPNGMGAPIWAIVHALSSFNYLLSTPNFCIWCLFSTQSIADYSDDDEDFTSTSAIPVYEYQVGIIV